MNQPPPGTPLMILMAPRTEVAGVALLWREPDPEAGVDGPTAPAEGEPVSLLEGRLRGPKAPIVGRPSNKSRLDCASAPEISLLDPGPDAPLEPVVEDDGPGAIAETSAEVAGA